MKLETIIDRLSIEPGPFPTPCWIWKSYKCKDGYGRTYDSEMRLRNVHLIVYELLRAPVAEGHELHHMCETPACCNPRHLTPLTKLEHAKTKDYSGAQNNGAHWRNKTHCPHGHEYTPENIRWIPNPKKGNMWRGCRACDRQNYLNRKARKLTNSQP